MPHEPLEHELALLLRRVRHGQLVENGLESTTEEAIDSAMIIPTAPTAPVSMNGTASGISAPRMPVVEANAETIPPT